MTEKQFKLFVGKNYGVQTVDGEVIFDSIISIAEAEVLVDLLNELAEGNEQLKRNYNSLSHNNGLLYDECSNKINALKKENKHLKAFIRNEFPKSYKHILKGFE